MFSENGKERNKTIILNNWGTIRINYICATFCASCDGFAAFSTLIGGSCGCVTALKAIYLGPLTVMQEPAPKQPNIAPVLPKLSFLLLVATMFLASAMVIFLFILPSEQKNKDFYTFQGVNIRGKLISLEKYRGSVSTATSRCS